jgi:hypothetical protein
MATTPPPTPASRVALQQKVDLPHRVPLVTALLRQRSRRGDVSDAGVWERAWCRGRAVRWQRAVGCSGWRMALGGTTSVGMETGEGMVIDGVRDARVMNARILRCNATRCDVACGVMDGMPPCRARQCVPVVRWVLVYARCELCSDGRRAQRADKATATQASSEGAPD